MREPRYVGRTTSGSHVFFLCPFTNFCLENVKDIDMNTQGSTRAVQNLRGGSNPLSTSLIADVLPEAKTSNSGERSQTGVSTRNAPLRTTKQEDLPHWFALRTTYGREKKAYEYIISHKGTAFFPTISKEKIVNGKKKLVVESRLPNIFFAYGTEEDIKSFVYDNYNLPFLRFYYKHTHIGSRVEKSPMIVPDKLSLEEKKHLRKLTITGTLNGQDIALLRRMLGATDSWQKGAIVINTRGQWTGELQDLDIENVTFAKDNKVPFLRMKATEGDFSWGKRKYHIGDSLDNKEFEKMIKTPLSHGKGFGYVM